VTPEARSFQASGDESLGVNRYTSKSPSDIDSRRKRRHAGRKVPVSLRKTQRHCGSTSGSGDDSFSCVEKAGRADGGEGGAGGRGEGITPATPFLLRASFSRRLIAERGLARARFKFTRESLDFSTDLSFRSSLDFLDFRFVVSDYAAAIETLRGSCDVPCGSRNCFHC